MKRLLTRILSYLPTSLPVGVSEFESWADSVLALSGLTITRESAHQALANMIIHAGPMKGSDTPRSHISKNHFVKGLRKGAANQIASHIFYELQKELEEKRKSFKAEEDRVAAELKQQAEATATETVANGQKEIPATPSEVG